MLTITLLGGESTGKSTLAQALSASMRAQDIAHELIPEHLREWCARHGRAPLAHEQAAIASEQARLINNARAHTGSVVLADTAPLMIAAYSELYFADRSLWPEALAFQRRVDLTLLMGLDLPWVADGLFRDSPTMREATDQLLRRELQAAGIPFQTVYGQGEARTEQALRAVGRCLGRTLTRTDPAWPHGRRPWNCEKCSDPGCEHRIFTQLLQQRSTNA